MGRSVGHDPVREIIHLTVWPNPRPTGAHVQKQAGKGKGLHLECIESSAAGIDVGATEIYVAVPQDRDPQPVRCFQTFTDDLRQMATWLVQIGITTAAMESTGFTGFRPTRY